jgi:hypothetical protein
VNEQRAERPKKVVAMPHGVRDALDEHPKAC